MAVDKQRCQEPLLYATCADVLKSRPVPGFYQNTSPFANNGSCHLCFFHLCFFPALFLRVFCHGERNVATENTEDTAMQEERTTVYSLCDLCVLCGKIPMKHNPRGSCKTRPTLPLSAIDPLYRSETASR